MSRLTSLLASCMIVVTATCADAQPVAPAPAAAVASAQSSQAPQPAQPAQPASPAARAEQTPDAPARRAGKPVNVRVEVTVTEQVGSKPAHSKQLILTTADGESAQIRNQPEVATPGPVLAAPFSVDAHPRLLDGNRLLLMLSIDYNVVDATSEKGARNQVRSRQDIVLESGKPLVVSESTDPMTERRVTVTVTATILK